MVEEVMANLWRIEVPLPQNPLKSINAYVLKGPSRNLIVDTGLNRKECYDAMRAGLDELSVDMRQTDLFISHLHADHYGLAPRLATETSKLYFNQPDAEALKNMGHWEPMLEYGARNGFPQDTLRAALNSHPGYRHGPTSIPELTLLEDGDVLHAGGYSLQCILTPGHTRGHTCLYEPDRKFLLAGDHLLVDITPNIQCWSDQGDPLKDYLASLDKVRSLEVDLVLPGHRRLFRNHRERIEELKGHHEKRTHEILSILDSASKTAFQVASEMTWDIDCESWDAFPVAQKWFATGETIAHLRTLEKSSRIFRKTEHPMITFARRV